MIVPGSGNLGNQDRVRVLIKNREFEVVFVTHNKNRAYHKAERHKRDFHTLVRELSPGVFYVLRRPKTG